MKLSILVFLYSKVLEEPVAKWQNVGGKNLLVSLYTIILLHTITHISQLSFMYKQNTFIIYKLYS